MIVGHDPHGVEATVDIAPFRLWGTFGRGAQSLPSANQSGLDPGSILGKEDTYPGWGTARCRTVIFPWGVFAPDRRRDSKYDKSKSQRGDGHGGEANPSRCRARGPRGAGAIE